MNPKKKRISAIIIWVTGLLLSCCLTGFLFMIGGAGATEGPSANLKIQVPSGRTIAQTFALAEKVILSLGYTQWALPEKVESELRQVGVITSLELIRG